MKSTLGEFSVSSGLGDAAPGLYGALQEQLGIQILCGLTSLAPGQVHAKQMPIYVNRLGSPRVPSPEGLSPMVVTMAVDRPQGFRVLGLGTHDLAFWEGGREAVGLQGAGDDVSPANPCPAEATTLPDPLMLTLDNDCP